MPAAEDKLVEKLPFDVYAMMLIMSLLATGGSIALLQDELQSNWGSDAPENTKRVSNLTYLNPQKLPSYTKASNEVLCEDPVVMPTDLDDYQTFNNKPLDDSGFKYPGWLDPLKNPVHDDENYDTNLKNVPPDVLNKLVESYKDPSAEPSGAAPTPPAGN